MSSDWIILLPYILLAGGGLFIFCAGIARPKASGLFFATAVISVCAAGMSAFSFTPAGPGYQGMIDASAYARFFVSLVCIVSLIALLFSFRYAALKGIAGDEYFALILFAALGMALAACALDWIVFFVGLELLSVSFYILIGSAHEDPASNEAALKYFVMGSVASGFLVFGVALLFSATGSLDIARSLGKTVSGENMAVALLGLGLIAAGMGFKVSLVPFHLWTPDVYQGAPAPITAFLSTGSKAAMFAALLRFSLNMSPELFAYMTPFLWVIAALTMIVGNITALAQTHIKRLLAYSSIAQMGYVLMALLAVKSDGASAVMFYLSAYAVMDLGAFGAVALLSRGDSDLDAIRDYRGLGFSHPWTSALLAVCLLSLAGLPPTAGFIGKIIIFKSVLQAGFTVLAVIGIVTAIISVYFYLDVIVALFMRPEEVSPAAPYPGMLGAVLCACMLATVILLGIAPSPLLSLIAGILHGFSI
ncbi:MAG: NADH-quinone oxidoreductase subunit N [Syntrophobacteraceae bacterium]